MTTAAAAGSGPCRSAATTSSVRTSSSAPADYDFSGIKGDMSVPLQLWTGEREAQVRVGGRRPGRLASVAAAPGLRVRRLHRGAIRRRRFLLGDLAIRLACQLPKHTYTGWFLGAGYEYGIGWLPGPVLEVGISLRRLRLGHCVLSADDRGFTRLCTNAPTSCAASWSGASTSAARWSRATDRS